MIFFGLDPGSGGAIAVLDDDGFVLRIVKNSETDRDVADALCGWETDKMFAVIENVHAFPGQGVCSVFAFGKSFGFLLGLLTMARIPFAGVSPQAWQKAMGIAKRKKDESKTSFKNRLKQKAQQLFPKEKITLANADAILIAEYCRRTNSSIFGCSS